MKVMKKSFTAKLLTVMRICAVQGVLALTLCGVSIAHPHYAQVLDRPVTLNVSEVSFERALHEIEFAANVKFAYSPDQLKEEQIVTLHAENKMLRAVLDELLVPRKITYKVHEREASITLKKQNGDEDDQSLLKESEIKPRPQFLIQITGTITEATSQQPMAGVNVIVKGTTNGTTTDSDGRYRIGADEGDILIFSFIGYASQEIRVTSQSVIDVVMLEDVKSLNEVVVNAGYWEVKEREQTGSISRLTAETIEKQPVSNPLQAIQGRMTGVHIQQNTGIPGGGFSIQVRGQNSLRSGTSGTVNGNLPLYVVDGVPFTSTSLTSAFTSGSNLRGGNPLSTIDPRDIESIEVLKDADATAIYGSRGANGVILITTKRAKAGKARVSIDLNHGIGQVSRFMDLLNTPQYLTMRREAIRNDGYEAFLSDPTYNVLWPDLTMWDTTRYTDWQKKLIGGTANTTNAQLSLSGGSENTRFLLGGGYYKESTVFPGDNFFQRISGKLNINHTSDDSRLKVNATINYSTNDNNIPSTDFTSAAVSLAPNAPAIYDENGNINWAEDTWSNPIVALERAYESKTQNFIANTLLSYQLIPGLSARTSLGYTSMIVDELIKDPLSAYSPLFLTYGITGSSYFGEGKINTWIVEPQIDYQKQISDGTLSVSIGATMQESVQSGKTIAAYGYTSDALLENVDAASTIDILDANYAQYRYAALFARVNYNWKQKYLLNLTGRRDGSSRFGPGKQYANFGAIGAGWIFSNESFLTASNILSFGKLRTSYGTTGNDAIGNYQYLETFAPTNYPYQGSPGLVINRLANPDYSWETNAKFEAAVELGFFKDRVSFSASYYLNRSSGQLVGLPLPVMTGQSSVQFNLPAVVENKGWEFQISASWLKSDHLQWTSSMNITIPSNRLLEFPDLEEFPAFANRFELGESVYILKGFQYKGVDPQTGLYTFEDLNGDDAISSPDDIIGIKSVTQQSYGGIGNNLRYGNFQLDIFFQFVSQTGYNTLRSFAAPGGMSNQPLEVINRWMQAGDESDIQQFTYYDPSGTVQPAYSQSIQSDRAIGDASFIRLKNVSISWTLPSKWIGRLKMNTGRIYLQGQNLFTITNYKGLDPENQNSQSLPPLAIATLGMHLSF